MLNNSEVKEEIIREIPKYFKLNDEENKISQNLWMAK